MKYIIQETGEEFTDIEAVLRYCIEEDYHEYDDYFEEWLNDLEESATIGGHTFTAYEILNGCDDDMLNDFRNDFCERMNEDDEEEARRELNRADDGDVVEIQRYSVTVVDDEYEDEDAGDYDGDDALFALRVRLEQDKEINEAQKAEEEKTENDLMNMFQIVGG